MWTQADIDEWFADDRDEAHAMMDYERDAHEHQEYAEFYFGTQIPIDYGD